MLWLNLQLTVESLKDGGRLKSAAGVTEGEATQVQREGKVIRKPVLLDAEVQTTVASAQTKDLEVLETIPIVLQDYMMNS